MSERIVNFTNALGTLSAYSGRSADEITTNVRDVMTSGDERRMSAFISALSTLPAYMGRTPDEIANNVRDVLGADTSAALLDEEEFVRDWNERNPGVLMGGAPPTPTPDLDIEGSLRRDLDAVNVREHTAPHRDPRRLQEYLKDMTPEEYDKVLETGRNIDDVNSLEHGAYREHVLGGGIPRAVARGAARSAIPLSHLVVPETVAERRHVEDHPYATMAGAVGGGVASALVGGAAVTRAAKTIPATAKLMKNSAIARTLIPRVVTSTGAQIGRDIGRVDFEEGAWNALTAAGGATVSLIPEIYAPANVWQLLWQPAIDLAFDLSVATARGEDVKSKEWWINEGLSLGVSAGFAIRDVASGRTFRVEQGLQRNEIKRRLRGWTRGKGKEGFVINDSTPVPAGQEQTAPTTFGRDGRGNNIARRDGEIVSERAGVKPAATLDDDGMTPQDIDEFNTRKHVDERKTTTPPIAKSEADLSRERINAIDEEDAKLNAQLDDMETGAGNDNLLTQFDNLASPKVSSESVQSVFKDRASGKSLTQRVKDWIADHVTFGEFKNRNTGWNVEFNKNSAKQVRAHNAGAQKLALLEYAPELIEDGVFLETKPKNEDGLITHVFAAKANIDGQDFAVAYAVREDNNGRRYYDHNITDIKNVRTSHTPDQNRDDSPEHLTDILLKHINTTKIQQNPSKVNSESEKNKKSFDEDTLRPEDEPWNHPELDGKNNDPDADMRRQEEEYRRQLEEEDRREQQEEPPKRRTPIAKVREEAAAINEKAPSPEYEREMIVRELYDSVVNTLEKQGLYNNSVRQVILDRSGLKNRPRGLSEEQKNALDGLADRIANEGIKFLGGDTEANNPYTRAELDVPQNADDILSILRTHFKNRTDHENWLRDFVDTHERNAARGGAWDASKGEYDRSVRSGTDYEARGGRRIDRQVDGGGNYIRGMETEQTSNRDGGRMERKIDVETLRERAIMPRSARKVSDAVELLRPMVGKTLTNDTLGLSGTLSNNSLKKMRDETSVVSSSSPRLHALAVANADVLFKNAAFEVTHSDRNEDVNIRQMHRLGAIMFDDISQRYVPVMITVKEFSDDTDNRIYTIEAIDVADKESPAGVMFRLVGEDQTLHAGLDNGNSAGRTAVRMPSPDLYSGQGQSSPNTEFNNKIHDLLEKVNTQDKKNKNNSATPQKRAENADTDTPRNADASTGDKIGAIRSNSFGDSGLRPVEPPEMVEIARKLLGSAPRVMKFLRGQARGMAHRAKVDGVWKWKKISLQADTVKDKIADYVLAHEIGHVLSRHAGTGSQPHALASKVMNAKHEFRQRANANRAEYKKAHAELYALSKKWRPFDETKATPKDLRYRKSVEEVFADAISVLLNDPDLLKQESPTFWRMFTDTEGARNPFTELYKGVQELYGKGNEAVSRARSERMEEGFDEWERQSREQRKAIIAEEREKGRMINVAKSVYSWLVERNSAMKKLVETAKKDNAIIAGSDDPYLGVRAAKYVKSEQIAFMLDVMNAVEGALGKIDPKTSKQLGKYLTYARIAYGDRGELWNPGGHTETTSKRELAQMKRELGDERYEQIEAAAKAFAEVRQDYIVTAIKESGAFGKEYIEKVLSNPRYATFEVLRKLVREYGADAVRNITGTPVGAHKQVGTVQAIRNPFMATMENDMKMLAFIDRNTTNRNAVKLLLSHGKELGFEIKPTKRGNDGRFIVRDSGDKNARTVFVLEDGERRAYDISPEIAKSLIQKPRAAVAELRGWQKFNNYFRNVLTQKNPAFWAWNLQRDFRRFHRNIDGNMLEKAWNVMKAYPEVWGYVTKGKMSEDMKQALRERAMLPSSAYSKDMFYDLDSALYKQLTGATTEEAQNNIIARNFGKLMRGLDTINDTMELATKLAGYKLLRSHKKYAHLSPEARAHMVRTRIGTPDIYAGGDITPVTNNLFMFSNVAIQGMREDFAALIENPKRAAFITAYSTVLPATIAVLSERGVLADFMAELGFLEEEAKWLEDAYAKIPKFDKVYRQVIPWPIETSSGGQGYTVLPHSETGAIMQGIVYHTLDAMFEAKDENWQAVADNAHEVLSGLLGISPIGLGGLHPTLKVIDTWGQYAVAKNNPVDRFRNRHIIPRGDFGEDKLAELAALGGWTWNNVGGSIIIRIDDKTLDFMDEDKDKAERVLAAPAIGNPLRRLIRFTDPEE